MSITVAVLKELGKIKTDVGQAIVSAAIIDDVIGIIVLTIVLGVSSGKGGYLWNHSKDTGLSLFVPLLQVLLFTDFSAGMTSVIHVHAAFLFMLLELP